MATSTTTRDHGQIRRWAEDRGATPSHVIDTGSPNDIGVLRLEFEGYSGTDRLEPISWEQFFEKFDERSLVLVYQELTAEGQKSNFNKLISAETADQAERKSSRSGGGKSRKSVSRAPSRGSGTRKSASAARSSSASSSRKASPGKKNSSAKKASATKKKTRPTKKAASRGPSKTARKSATKRAAAGLPRSSRKATKKAVSKKSSRRR